MERNYQCCLRKPFDEKFAALLGLKFVSLAGGNNISNSFSRWYHYIRRYIKVWHWWWFGCFGFCWFQRRRDGFGKALKPIRNSITKAEKQLIQKIWIWKYTEYIQETAFRDATNKNLFALGFPETSTYTQHLVELYDLADTLRQSNEVQQNGLLISGSLNGLADDLKVAEEEINDFRHKSSGVVINLQHKVSLIYDILDVVKSSDEDENVYLYDTFIPDLFVEQFYKIITYWDDEQNFSGFIQRQLKVLELVFRELKGQLNKMIDSFSKVKLDARHLSFYLLNAEREAESAIKNYWAESFIDHCKIIRAEKELRQVRQMKKFTKSLVANLNEFDHYLRDYQRKLFDVETDIVYTRALKKLSKGLLNYLKTSANQFQKTHRLFDIVEEKIGGSQSMSLKNTITLEYEESYIPPYLGLIY
ncbi:4064_t:CDS:2 [Ambispora leptoticha]|uniref:4064_t:CDS:1 n=1 Tax=Ambispora leptoticha TaxID=144679 RepID=A0A9N9FF00_9GLOM|nr:4064_t:CDS:2 [Ambispora leptoticha]